MTQFQAGADGAKPATAAQQAEQASELQQQAAGKALAAAAAQSQRPLEKPEPEKFSVPVPEGLAYEMVDLIKLTAQHVARNGSGFLTGQLWATGWPCCIQAGPSRGQGAQAGASLSAVKMLNTGSTLRSQCCSCPPERLHRECSKTPPQLWHLATQPEHNSPLRCRSGQG